MFSKYYFSFKLLSITFNYFQLLSITFNYFQLLFYIPKVLKSFNIGLGKNGLLGPCS